ncbi:MAG: cache domain-containing protein [Methanoregula sp.]
MDGLSRQHPIKMYRRDTVMKDLSFFRDNISGMTLNCRLPVITGILIIALLISAGCTQTSPATVQTETPAPTTGAAVRETPPAAAVTTVPQTATREEMVAFVQEAVAYAKQNGKENALAEFSNRNGSFFRGVLYIYAYDYNGTTIAHPVNPEKIGVNRLQEPDAEGTWFITNLREAAYNGTGFSTYTYVNPVHNNTVEKKLGYVMKVDDSWWLGSGVYSGPADTPVTK